MIPLSLYIHTPWCIRKCPYCDFNSHKSPDTLPEAEYIDALLSDFRSDLAHFPGREIQSLFVGGGTPSLLSADAYHRLFEAIQKHVPFAPNIEMTLEANPGTIEQQRFSDYCHAGFNRLSIGIQSFQDHQLNTLGRIHSAEEAHRAIETARQAGFSNMNLDIMHSLPKQSIAEGLQDLQEVLAHEPEHISWYQLTIEPNTVFYKEQPPLPSDDDAYALEQEGIALLAAHGFQRYEISAFSRAEKRSRHNLNYWLFGDYYGIGAGAHGKLTTADGIFRTRKYRLPKDYLASEKPFLAASEKVSRSDLVFEFMLNTSRLQQAIPYDLFVERTGLPLERLSQALQLAETKGFITCHNSHWQITPHGRHFTNDFQALFLPE